MRIIVLFFSLSLGTQAFATTEFNCRVSEIVNFRYEEKFYLDPFSEQELKASSYDHLPESLHDFSSQFDVGKGITFAVHKVYDSRKDAIRLFANIFLDRSSVMEWQTYLYPRSSNDSTSSKRISSEFSVKGLNFSAPSERNKKRAIKYKLASQNSQFTFQADFDSVSYVVEVRNRHFVLKCKRSEAQGGVDLDTLIYSEKNLLIEPDFLKTKSLQAPTTLHRSQPIAIPSKGKPTSGTW
jgi:hypothetical protein